MNKKSNIIVKVGAIVVSIVLLFTIYLVITKNRLSKNIEFYSFDKKNSIVIDLDSNITEYSYGSFNESISLAFKNRNDFINSAKRNENYYGLSEYNFEDKKITKILWHIDNYFYVICVYDDYATIKNLVTYVAGQYYFPFVNESIYISVSSVDNTYSGGEIIVSTDELNNNKKYIIKEKIFFNYSDVKLFLQKTNNEYYQFDDENKTIKVKLYSDFKFDNGTNIADGYPVTVEFIENETKVKISVDLSVFD